MRDGAEVLLTSAAVTALALVLFPFHVDGGASAAGSGGESTVSVRAASASVEQMVERWGRPPETVEVIAAVAPPVLPQVTAVARPAPTPEPVTNALPMAAAPSPEQAPPESEAPPERPEAPDTVEEIAEVAPPETPPPSELAPQPSDSPRVPMPIPVRVPIPEDRPPETDTTTPEATRTPAQSPRPPARPASVAARASQERAEQRAAGVGNTARAGTQNTSATTQRAPANRASLMAAWGGQIQARIASRAPRGAGRGTAIVVLSVSRGGGLVSVGLGRSSGNSAVDRLALRAVRSAGGFPPAPPGLGGGPFSFSIPIQSR